MREQDIFCTVTSETEVASLAFKFYLDNDCQEGHDGDNWFCAEHMLAQKQMIESQISALHSHLHGVMA